MKSPVFEFALLAVAAIGFALTPGCDAGAGGGNGAATDLCAEVECGPGQQCDADTGLCVPDGGEGEGEGEGEGNGQGPADGDGTDDGTDGTADDGPAVADLVEVPDPLSGDNPTYQLIAADVPGPGESVTDSRLGAVQTRVTQAEQLRHEYARYDAFNADQSMIILHDVMEGDFLVYRTGTVPYDDEGNLVTSLDLEEARWDPVDPATVWGIDEFRLLTVDVAAAETSLVKDFSSDATISPILGSNPDLYRITRHFEGESSRDKRYWVFALQGTNEDYRDRYLFTWDRERDEVLGVYELAAAESLVDWVGMSPLGTWVLIGADWDNAAPLTGLILANRELTEFHQLDQTTAHADVGLDTEGNEVIVMQNTVTDHIDLIPLDRASGPVDDETLSYAGTNRTPLVRLFYDSESSMGFHGGLHVSCNAPGWCVVSIFVGPDEPEQNWLDRAIVLIRLDREDPQVFHLAKVHGSTGAYWEETQASITNDGTRVIWATNWSQSVGQERVWVMQLDIPAD
ncbi:MAG: hypothetical protein ACYSUI_14940 [Planctomycetota bacterium]|jgi:hypothetical protein